MLIGEYRHTLDPKNRLAIPAKFRKELDRQVVITRGFDNCLFIYTLERWQEFAEKLAGLPIGARDNRSIGRFMLAGAIEADIDAAGRVLIPDYLKQFAGLGESVVVAGMHTRIELWSSEKWEEHTRAVETKADALAEKLGDIGMI